MEKIKDEICGEAFSCIMEAHWRAVGRGEALRNIGKRQVSRVCYNGKSYIVKTYRRGLFRRLLGMSMHSSAGLKCLEGLTPRCLCNQNEGKWQVTVLEDAGKNNLFELEKQINKELQELNELLKKNN